MSYWMIKYASLLCGFFDRTGTLFYISRLYCGSRAALRERSSTSSLRAQLSTHIEDGAGNWNVAHPWEQEKDGTNLDFLPLSLRAKLNASFDVPLRSILIVVAIGIGVSIFAIEQTFLLPPTVSTFLSLMSGMLVVGLAFFWMLHRRNIRWRKELAAIRSEVETHEQERMKSLMAANATLQAEITDRQRAETRTQALLAVTEDISGTFDLHTLLQCVQRRTVEILPCDIVGTFYWNPQSETFRLISQHGLPDDLAPAAMGLAFPIGQPFDGQVAAGHTVVINTSAAQPPALRQLLGHFHVKALGVVPLRVRGSHLGALVACSTTEDYGFDEDKVELLKGIAQQLAVAIEAADLYKRQQEETEIAEILAHVGQTMIASLDTKTLLGKLCQLTAEALESNCSCTFLRQPEEDSYKPVAEWGLSLEHKTLLSVLQLPTTIVADLVGHLQEHEILEGSDPIFRNLTPQILLQRCGLTNVTFLRLRRGQELIGFLACGYQEAKEPSSRHTRIASGIANIASLALANAKLLEELDRANRIKEDFMGAMSHELRTPLNVIIGYTQLMEEETFGPLSTEQNNILRRISRSTNKLLDLVSATLDLGRLQNQQRIPLHIQAIEGAALLAELNQTFCQFQLTSTVGLHWKIREPLPLIRSDAVKLKMVLKNLITNAMKFTDTGAITISAEPQHDGVAFSVTDTGIGIAREALPIIFEPFRQVDDSVTRRYGGVGLGLYIVRQLVELLGGNIAVESEVGRGSTFRVWIPTVYHEQSSPRTEDIVTS